MSKIDRVENRIRQIEQRIERGPQINSAAFNQLMAGHSEPKRSSSLNSDAAATKLNNMGHFNLSSIKGLDRNTHASGAGASPPGAAAPPAAAAAGAAGLGGET